MPPDTKYQAVPFIYRSKGLTARPAQDEAPEFTYLNLMNCLERAEGSMSSRYGTQIINRDPLGTGVLNYFFPTPVTSLSRLVYLGQSYRYAGTLDGKLWRRAGDVQGQYSQIDTRLSGQPFESTVTNCFLTAQPYLFIYDKNISLKDSGVLATPQLVGLDPSPYTVNATPYSPLLTLIDNFASSNSYTTSGFSSAWSFNSVARLSAVSGQTVTDFSEFFGVQPFGAGSFSISGGTTSAVATAPASNSGITTYSGFASTPVTGTETVSLNVTLSGGGSHIPGRVGAITVTLLYSVDSGASFTPFYSESGGQGTFWAGGSLSQSILGLTNLSTLQVQVQVTVASTTGTSSVSATLGTIEAIVASPDVFGDVTNGMLSVLGSAAINPIQIASIQSSGLSGGIWQTLTITTQTAHGLTGNPSVAVYGSSNDLADGFYTGTVTSATTLTVPYLSAVQIGSTGGILYGGAASPATCVLTNEYSTPYPTQMSGWGFYQQVSPSTNDFPVGSWKGTVAQNTTAQVGVTVPINLNINNQANDDDLIVVTIAVSDPASISNIRLQFDVNGSGFTSAYYYKDIAPAYYQQNVQQLEDAYTATSQQIFADTLGLLTGQPPNSTNAQLQPGNISTGQGAWQTIYLRRGDFVPVGIAGESGSDWAAISGWQLVITTNTVGSSDVSVNGLYFQWGYGPSSFGGVGYDYRVTPYNAATGTEGNGTPIQKFDPQFGYLASLVAPTYLRQAVQITGQYFTDTQVTHLRVYRRGGNRSANWFQIDQVPNIPTGGQFVYKDVIPDAVLAEAQPLILDNDPPVTSSLQFPINTTLAAPTSSPGSSIYSQFSQQLVTVAAGTANFVVDQIVLIGYATNLEEVRVINGGTGQFTAIVRLQHNQGEPVSVSSIPRQPCNLVAQAYGQVWVAGDPNNPHFLYFSKRARPENFGPQDYIPVGSPSDPINAIINWRGTLFVATLTTWYQIIGGAQPYAQPTGSKHGVVAQQGWAQTESAIWYRCLPDDESEALTRNGWKSRDQLIVGEEVLAYDIKSKVCKWTPVESINVFEYDGDLVNIKDVRSGSRFNFSCTPDHKWVWKPEPRNNPFDEKWKAHPKKYIGKYDSCLCGMPKSKKAKICKNCLDTGLRGDKLKAAKDISVCGNLIQAGLLCAAESLLTPREAAILGWIVTDGSISKNNGVGRRSARIHQAEKSRHLGDIRFALGTNLMSTYSREISSGFKRKSGNNVVELDFALGTDFTEYLLRKSGFETRDDLPRIVCSLDLESARAMLEAMISADGSRGKSISFCQNRNPVMEAFRILALMCGFPTSSPRWFTDDSHKNEHGRVNLIRNPNIDCQGLKKTSRRYKGKVWCPTTILGTWVARSNDTISITGNSADGLREFQGADGRYMTLPVEEIYRSPNAASPTPVPLVNQQLASGDVMAYFNNVVYTSYISQSATRFRLNYDTQYIRFRSDDVPATAMLWEQDINTLLVAKTLVGGPNNGANVIVQDQFSDFDDGGWAASQLTVLPITMTIQTPYTDLGQPHYPKQYNVLESDVNTQSQQMTTTLLFNTEPPLSLALPNYTGDSLRHKKQFQVALAGAPQGSGVQAYSMSIQHTLSVTAAPTLYQENIYAAVLADYRSSFDTYWLKMGTDESKIVRQCYFDYTSTQPISVSIYADGSSIPYYTFTLPSEPTRLSVRILFPAWKPRLWRMIGVCNGDYQFWQNPVLDFKPIKMGSTWTRLELLP